MSQQEPIEQQTQGVTLPIEWYIPESVQSRYATNAIIQTGQREFTISFFETRLPILFGQSQENQESLEKIGKVRAECVGRIVVAPDTLQEMIAAFQTNLDAYREAKLEE